jgi:hypothetical protein
LWAQNCIARNPDVVLLFYSQGESLGLKTATALMTLQSQWDAAMKADLKFALAKNSIQNMLDAHKIRCEQCTVEMKRKLNLAR